jgi:hypothetical protein
MQEHAAPALRNAEVISQSPWDSNESESNKQRQQQQQCVTAAVAAASINMLASGKSSLSCSAINAAE